MDVWKQWGSSSLQICTFVDAHLIGLSSLCNGKQYLPTIRVSSSHDIIVNCPTGWSYFSQPRWRRHIYIGQQCACIRGSMFSQGMELIRKCCHRLFSYMGRAMPARRNPTRKQRWRIQNSEESFTEEETQNEHFSWAAVQEPPVPEESLHQEVAKESVDWRLMFNTCLHVSMFASIHGCMYPCLQVSMFARTRSSKMNVAPWLR